MLEVYPYVAMVLLFGKQIPRKNTKEGLQFLVRHLGRRIGSIDICTARFDHDLCDALASAYVGYLASQGLTSTLGLSAEALSVVPKDPSVLSQLDGMAPAW